MNVLITGGSKGIGRELVLKFAEDVANNVVVFSRNQDQLKALKQECLERFNNEIVYYSIDYLENDIEEKIKSTLNQLDTHFHIVINNAGLLINKLFDDSTMKEWEDTFKVNSLVPMLIIKYTLKLNISTQNCHIVNIASMGGVQGSVKFPGLSAYSGSKAALINLTECLAEELKESNTMINSLALGAVQTEMLQEAFPDYKANINPKQMANFIHQFSTSNDGLLNGKVIPVSNSTP